MHGSTALQRATSGTRAGAVSAVRGSGLGGPKPVRSTSACGGLRHGSPFPGGSPWALRAALRGNAAGAQTHPERAKGGKPRWVRFHAVLRTR